MASRTSVWRFWRATLVGAASFVAADAGAQTAAPEHHAVIVIEGAPSSPTDASVAAAVRTRIAVVDEASFLAAAKAEGASFTAMPPSARTLQAVRRVADKEGVDAVVLVRTVSTARGRQVSVEAVDARRGSFFPLHAVRLAPRSSPEDDAKFGDLLADLETLLPSGPVATGTTPAPPPALPATPVPAGPPEAPPPPPVVIVQGDDVAYERVAVELDFDGADRQFSYHDGLSKNLRSYSLAFAPGGAAWIDLYPFSGIDPALRDLGITFDMRGTFAKSEAAGGSGTIGTVGLRYDAGLRYRLRFGPPLHPFLLGLSTAFAREQFAFSPEGPGYPAAAYSCLRLQADGRVPIGANGLTLSVAYLPVFSADGFVSSFRDASEEAVEISAGFAVHIARGWEVDVRGIYTRFFMSFNPSPGDAYVAGGALDQFFHGEVGVKGFY
jgi:hypothetical protein